MPEPITSNAGAWIALGGTSFGGLIGFLGALWTSRAALVRERESRRELRRDAARQRQNETQRETLQGLQGGTGDLLKLAAQLQMFTFTQAAKTGVWLKGEYPHKVHKLAQDKMIKNAKLSVRVLDDFVRGDGREFVENFHLVFLPRAEASP